MKQLAIWALSAVLCAGTVVHAEQHQLRVPLRDGKLSLPELSAAMTEKLHLPAVEWGSAAVDVQGIGGSMTVAALNKALGDGCRVSVDKDAVVIQYDPAKLPHNLEQAKHATRVFTAEVAPEATAIQASKYGLLLPAKVSPKQRTVILVHGVDCTRECISPLGDLLKGEGYQVAYFSYRDDQAIADSAADFLQQLKAVRETFPEMPLDVVAFSMGGLVSRAAIEGDDYPGGVGRLIMLAPPNHGSKWAHVREVLEVREQYELWKTDPNWKWTWSITDGLGEAGTDLLPDSKFLKQLNEKPRRAGVKYTIVNGNEHPMWKAASKAADGTVWLLGDTVSGWLKADRLADNLRNHEAKSDGPVSIESTRLAGVDDIVTVRADHNGIYQGSNPAAWPIIKDRLGK
jgi:pimeloyl-ACP methyl ester carboxylesterase